MTASRELERSMRAFADRLFMTGGKDPVDSMPIAEERLAIYRDGMRGNYRGMLRFAYTSALALVDRELAAGGEGLPRDADALIARFLQVAPAKTHSSREIADRFLVFLPREVPSLFARRPELLDLMRLERAELRAILAVDDPGRALLDDEIDALAAGPLEDLLGRTVVRAPSASIVRTRHHVVALRALMQSEDAPAVAPPPSTGAEVTSVARGAPSRFAIRLATHAPEEALVLEGAPPGTAIALERLALDWFAALSDEERARDDAWKAGVFAGAALAALRTGLFRVT